MIKYQPSLNECDWLSAQHITTALFTDERDLYDTKWWDYKPLHPLMATYVFAESFKRAIKEAIKRRTCLYRGLNFKGLKHDDFLNCTHAVITGLWKARQMADRIGIPYDMYCDIAMHYAEKRDYRFLPSPCHIYATEPKNKGDISMVDDIIKQWETVKKNRLLYAQFAYFNIYAYTKNRYQILHQRFLLDAVRNSPLAYLLVAELVFDKWVLSEEAVIKGIENGERLLERARKYHFD